MPDKKTSENVSLRDLSLRDLSCRTCRAWAIPRSFFPILRVFAPPWKLRISASGPGTPPAETVIWSRNLESIHGMMPGRFDGTLACFLNCIHQDDRERVGSAIDDAQRSGTGFRARYRTAAQQKDGRDERWVEASGKAIAKDGTSRRMLGLCYDVAERVSLDNELRNRAKQQEALAQFGERALAEPDLDRLLNDAVSTVALTLVGRLCQNAGTASRRHRTGAARRLWLEDDLIGTVLTTTEPDSFARLYIEFRRADCCRRFRRRERDFEVAGIFEGPQMRERRDRGHRRPRWARLRHSWRLHRQDAEFQRAGHFVPGRPRQSSGRRHSAPPARATARIDDPRHAASLRQPVFAVARLVFADRAKPRKALPISPANIRRGYWPWPMPTA